MNNIHLDESGETLSRRWALNLTGSHIMTSYAADFGPFDGRVWLNAASIGPLPKVAVKAAKEAIERNIAPHRLPIELYREVPSRLKRELAELIGVNRWEIIIGNSTSYGLHLLANGIPFKSGDEVLLVKGDFPASILPWLALRKQGVTVREIQPKGPALHADDVAEHLTEKTKLLCATWVDSFTGYALDEQAIGKVCKANDVWFVLNATQGIGARHIDVLKTPVDAIASTGAKWLLGPYGTGFCWVHPDLLSILEPNQCYWPVHHGDRDLDQMRDYRLREDLGAAAFDVFSAASHFNNVPWTACIEYLNAQGIPKIQQHNDKLVDQLINGFDPDQYILHSPRKGPARTAIVVASHREPKRTSELFEQLTKEGIDISIREGNLRISPHLYNTREEINQLLTVLNNAL